MNFLKISLLSLVCIIYLKENMYRRRYSSHFMNFGRGDHAVAVLPEARMRAQVRAKRLRTNQIQMSHLQPDFLVHLIVVHSLLRTNSLLRLM